MNNNLISIANFIELARKQGASFGGGDPKIHLAYLTKLGILPPSVKRKIAGEMTGCYEEKEITTVLKVEQLKNKGMTYSQIAKLTRPNTSVSVASVAGANNEENPTFSSLDDQTAFNKFNSNANENFAVKSSQLIRNPSFLYLIIGVLFGFLLSTLNSQGLAQLRSQANLTGNQPLAQNSDSVQSPSKAADSVYVISVPKQNLDKLDKTNINYLINN